MRALPLTCCLAVGLWGIRLWAQPPIGELEPEVVTPPVQPAPPATTVPDSFSQPNNFDFPPDSLLSQEATGPNGSVQPTSSLFQAPLVNGYLAETSTTGSIVNIPNINLPMTVNTVTRDTMNDQQVLNFRDMFRDIPSAVSAGDAQFPDRLFLRGLEVRSRDFRKNGFLDPTFTPRDFQNIERVEILKGPASVLYGSSAPSGTVNFITKKPLDGAFAIAGFQFGSWDMDRYVLDANTSIDPDGELLFRFNGAYENTNSFRDFGFTERHQLAPVMTWVIDSGTTLTWDTEIVRNRRRGDTGIPALGGDPTALPNSLYVGVPETDFIDSEDYRTSLILTHELNEAWTLQVGASTIFYEFPGSQTAVVAPLGGSFFARTRTDFQDQESASSLIINLAGNGYVGPFEHTMLFGTEQVYYDSEATFATSAYLAPFDVNNPSYVIPPSVPVFTAEFPVFRQYRQGYYMQDVLRLNDYWAVMGGVRFDTVDLTFERDFGFGFPVRSEQEFNRASPRGGIVFSPVPDLLSFYFSYTRSFNPPGGGGFPLLGGPVLPELGELYEVGVKSQLFDNLAAGFSVFHVTRDNVPFADFGPFGPVYFQVGEERSQGIELELLGRLTDRWSVIGNYAYTDTQLTDAANPLIVGQRQRNVPLNLGNIWTRYDLYQSRNETFGVAMGMVCMDQRSANLAGSVLLPGYTRWDSGVYYRWGRLQADVYLENLFDRNYSASSINEFQINPGAPFNGRAQLSVVY